MGSAEKRLGRHEIPPSWMREVHSMGGLAEAMQHPEIKAAYYTPPQHPNLDDFETVVRQSLFLQEDIDWKRGEKNYPKEIAGVFAKYTGSVERSARDPELVKAGINTLSAIHSDLQKIERAFPDYSLDHFDIQSRSFPRDQAIVGHQDNTPVPGKEILVLVVTYYGPSTEYAETKQGAEKTVLPQRSMVIHRVKKGHRESEDDPELPFHWSPEVPEKGRLSVLVMLTKNPR